jgi:undecaprenyl-diphosphatase
MTGFDSLIADAVVTFRTPALTTIMRAVTALGGLATLTVVTAMSATWLVSRGRRAQALFLSLSMALGMGTLVYGLKYLISRVRPIGGLIDVPGTPSFPSGHAFAALLFAGLVMIVSTESDGTTGHRRWMWALPVLAALVGLSRIYLGVHWASDVIASWAFAAIWLWVSVVAFRVWERRYREGAAAASSR